jgi:ribosomal protein L37AE/L43A
LLYLFLAHSRLSSHQTSRRAHPKDFRSIVPKLMQRAARTWAARPRPQARLLKTKLGKVNMWKCAECDETVEGWNYEFCWKCGARRPSEFDTPPNPKMISCPACQAKISDQAWSCPHCGQPMKMPATPTVTTHREALEEHIRPYMLAGYQVFQQTEYTITMVRPQKKLSVGTAVLLYVVFWPAGLAYTLSKLNVRDDVACFRVLPTGQIEINAEPLAKDEEKGRDKSGINLAWVTAGIATALAVLVVLIIAATR